MIDLERLRVVATAKGSDLMNEAADEIERLRASELALKRRLLLVTQNWQQGCPPLKQLDDDIQQLEQEIQESGS